MIVWPSCGISLCLAVILSLQDLSVSLQVVNTNPLNEWFDGTQAGVWPDEFTNSGVGLDRGKRLLRLDPSLHWPKGIVPYKFSDIMYNEYWNELDAIEWVMNVYEYFTPIRFVPWNKTINKDLNLGHEGFALFRAFEEKHGAHPQPIDENCYSKVGNQRDKTGQEISCCAREKCVHMIGHLLGFDHEQEHPDRDLWIRMNWEVMQKWVPFIKKPWKDYLHTTYDISSYMHFPQELSYFGNHKTLTYTDLFPEIKSVQRHFYMFKELCAVYKCQDYPQCKGFNLKCVNEGYVSVVNNECACICPPSLDPNTFCKSLIKGVSPTIQMPKGEYSLLQGGDDCPLGPFTKTTEVKAHQKLQMCSRTSEDCPDGTNCGWPPGEYCVIKKGNCPKGKGIKTGQINFLESSDPPFEFCCFENGFHEDPIQLPNTKPFSLFMKNIKQCQHVIGMRWKIRMIEFPYAEYDDGPYHEVYETSTLRLFVCDYTPVDMNCGSIITLSKTNPTVTIQSDRLKSSNRDCTWLVQGPENSFLILNFDEFNVRYTRTSCIDTVEVKYSRIGQSGVDYCGGQIKHSIRSILNKVAIRFQTGADSNSHFKATITLKTDSDMCYDPQDRGLSYGGNVSYTRRFVPCIPWKDATPCHHTPFEGGHVMNTLKENYCRNPDKSFRPWCYTNVQECVRDFCDVCHFEKVYDRVHDCDQYDCTRDHDEVASKCAASCQIDKTDRTSKASNTRCSNPGHLKDGLLQDSKTYYNVGEKVTYKCILKDTDRTIERECLTTGQWSAANTACLECPIGFGPHKGYCYRYFKERVTYQQAKETCVKLGSYLVTVLSKEENIFVNSLRARQGDFLWLGGYYNNVMKTFVWEDGKKIDWLPFSLAPPKVITKSSDMHFTLAWWKGWQRMDETEQEPFVCKVKNLDKPTCEDYLDGCEGLMKNKGNINCEIVPTYNNLTPNLKNVCRYSCGLCTQDLKCGGVIELNENNKMATFETGSMNQECTWSLHAQANKGALVLDFDEFDVESDQNGKCVDVMELRVGDLGELGTQYCGKELHESTVTTNNTILVMYRSHANSKSHLKATVKWIPESDWCYKLEDKGFSYGGNVSFTQSFKSCKSWDIATKCPHNPYNSKDLLKNLEKNYCRNPDDSPEPWCYTDVDTCQRESCDVCHWAKPFDRSPLCRKHDKKFCSELPKTTLENCASTCSDVFIQPAQKVSGVTCGLPKLDSRGPLLGVVKPSYNVGDNVTFHCSIKSTDTEELICLTSGQWAVYSTQCPVCPPGQAVFKGKCYNFKSESVGKESASDKCLVAMAKTSEKNNFLNLLREPGMGMWIGGEGAYNKGWKWDDKTPFKWTNWHAGGIIKDRLYNCIYMDDTKQWNTDRCYKGYSYACEYKGKKVDDNTADILNSCPSHFPSKKLCSQFPYLANLCPLTCRDYLNQ